MRTIRNNKDFKGKKLVSRITAIIIGVVGFLLCQPFIWAVMIFGEHEPYMSFARFIYVCIFILGLPMFFYGIIGLLTAGHTLGSASTDASDLGRIRHAVEMERMGRK